MDGVIKSLGLRFLLVLGSYILAFWVRQTYLSVYLSGTSQFEFYSSFAGVAILVYLSGFYLEGIFAKPWDRLPLVTRCLRHLRIAAFAFTILASTAFFLQFHLFSRTFLFAFVFIALGSQLTMELLTWRRRYRPVRVLYLGDPLFCQRLKHWVETLAHPMLFLDSELFLKAKNEQTFLEKFEPDEILLCSVSLERVRELESLVSDLQLLTRVRDLTYFFKAFQNSHDFKKYGEFMCEYFSEPSKRDHGARIKRVFDLSLVLGFLPIWGGVFLVLVVILKLKNQEVLYSQIRVGHLGRLFRIYKFRTMLDVEGGLKPCKEDQRLRPLGWFLRRTSLDELPQLFNVLTGDMSLVGPRPELLRVVQDEYKRFHWKRILLKPGLTGLWQIYGRKQPIHEYVKYDFFYLKNQSFWLDFWILLRTIPVVLLQRGAR
jgi:lipopolysaccharide/colanic/teichoic acid biosynthesis glycosyltransferase